jgi:MFS family permease
MNAFSLTRTQWLVCTLAALGFLFDTYELLMLPLIARPALMELGGLKPGTPEFATWFGMLFYIPAFFGGAFGLAGGYLTDLLGRKWVLIYSIVLYSMAAFASGFCTSLSQLLILRCLVFVGVSVEFVAAVAWLAELFDSPRQREAVLGTTQAFSSLGGLLVAVANSIITVWSVNQAVPLFWGLGLPAVQLPSIELPEFLSFSGTIGNPHASWRYTMMTGLIPALPLLLLRPFLPESPQWLRNKRAGLLKRPRVTELFRPELRRTTLLTTLMYTLSFAAAFGAIQQIPQIVPGMPEIQAAVEQAGANKRDELVLKGLDEVQVRQEMKAESRRLAGPIEQAAAARAMKFQEIGGLCGRLALAVLALYIMARGRLLRLFLLPGIAVLPLVFGLAPEFGMAYLEYGVFWAGFLTIAQFSFWGNYLPRVFPLHLRGTGESFAANVGGRMIGTCFAAFTQWLVVWMPIDAAYSHKVAYAAALVAFASYLINCLLSYRLPEPQGNDLPR